MWSISLDLKSCYCICLILRNTRYDNSSQVWMMSQGTYRSWKKFGKSWNLKSKFSRSRKVWKVIGDMEKFGKILIVWKLWGWPRKYSFSLQWLILCHPFVTLLSLYIADILWSKFWYRIDMGKDDLDPSLQWNFVMKDTFKCILLMFLLMYMEANIIVKSLENK